MQPIVNGMFRHRIYAEALPHQRGGCTETIEVTVRTRRLLFAGSIMRMGDERLPKFVLLGQAEEGKRRVGWKEHGWVHHLEEDLSVFNTRGEGGEAKEQRYVTIETLLRAAAWSYSSGLFLSLVYTVAE